MDKRGFYNKGDGIIMMQTPLVLNGNGEVPWDGSTMGELRFYAGRGCPASIIRMSGPLMLIEMVGST